LVAKLTFLARVGAALSVTVQVSLPAPVIDELLQDNELNTRTGLAALAFGTPADDVCADTRLLTDKRKIRNDSVGRLQKCAFRTEAPLEIINFRVVRYASTCVTRTSTRSQ
jgi:hypothetical protein